MNTGAGIIWKGKEIPALPSGVTYDPDRHEYRDDRGLLPSVTGFMREFQFQGGDDTAMKWGSAVHDHIFHYLRGTLNMKKVDRRILPYLRAIDEALEYLKLDRVLMLSEHIVYSRRHRFAGRLDYLFEAGPKDIFIDLKTGAKCEKSSRLTAMQLGGYVIAAAEMGLTKISQARIIELNIQMDGKWRPIVESNVRESANIFLARLAEVRARETVLNYLNKI